MSNSFTGKRPRGLGGPLRPPLLSKRHLIKILIRNTDGQYVSKVINLMGNQTNGRKHYKNAFFKYWFGKKIKRIITSIGMGMRKTTAFSDRRDHKQIHWRNNLARCSKSLCKEHNLYSILFLGVFLGKASKPVHKDIRTRWFTAVLF